MLLESRQPSVAASSRDRECFDDRPRRVRAKRTNDPSKLPGVDMRSRWGRRYADIIHTLIAEFGCEQINTIADLAVTRIALERLQEAIVGGAQGGSDELVRLGNLIARKEQMLGIHKRRRAQKPAPTLRESLMETQS